jgi:hypothetical protein
MRRPECRSVFGRYSMARPTASTPNQKLFGSSISKTANKANVGEGHSCSIRSLGQQSFHRHVELT